MRKQDFSTDVMEEIEPRGDLLAKISEGSLPTKQPQDYEDGQKDVFPDVHIGAHTETPSVAPVERESVGHVHDIVAHTSVFPDIHTPVRPSYRANISLAELVAGRQVSHADEWYVVRKDEPLTEEEAAAALKAIDHTRSPAELSSKCTTQREARQIARGLKKMGPINVVTYKLPEGLTKYLTRKAAEIEQVTGRKVDKQELVARALMLLVEEFEWSTRPEPSRYP